MPYIARNNSSISKINTLDLMLFEFACSITLKAMRFLRRWIKLGSMVTDQATGRRPGVTNFVGILGAA